MTPAWMSGYAGDIAYTLGFYRELAPSFLNYVSAIVGVDGIPTDRRLRYCELGSGRGYGTVLLAAANPGIEFVGIDFNPAHVSEARSLAAKAGVENVTFRELSFGDAARSTEPTVGEFDVVASHGVFTWVSDAVRQDIIAFLASKLVPGGYAYISYNSLPGWAPLQPMQHLIKEFADRGTGNSLARLGRGISVLKELAAKSAAYVGQNPVVKNQIDFIEQQDPNYLAGEYINDHWRPLYVDQALAAFAEAKLDFIASAAVAENRLLFCVPKDLIDFVGKTPDLALRELLKDYAVNKQFRRDIYVKGPRRLRNEEARQRYRALTFALISRPDPIPEKWRIPAGEATLTAATRDIIVGCLDRGMATGGEIIAAAEANGIKEVDVVPAMEILIHNGLVAPGPANPADVDTAPSRRLNDLVFDLTAKNDSHRFLAAPAIGSAIPTSFLERITAPVVHDNPQADDRQVAEKMFDRLEGAGNAFHREGKRLDRSDENLAEIASFVATFRARILPVWQTLGVV